MAGLREISICVFEVEDKCYAEITVSCSLSRRNLSYRYAPRLTQLCKELIEDILVGWTKHCEFRVPAVPLYLLLQSTRWQWGSLVPLLSCCMLWSSLRRGCRDWCSHCGRHSAAILHVAPLLSTIPGCLSCEMTRCSQSHLRSDSPAVSAVRGGWKERGALVRSNEQDFGLSTVFGSTTHQNCNCSTDFRKEMACAPPLGPLPASTAGAVLLTYCPVDDQLVGSPSASAEPRWCHSRCCRVPKQKQTAQVGLRKQKWWKWAQTPRGLGVARLWQLVWKCLSLFSAVFQIFVKIGSRILASTWRAYLEAVCLQGDKKQAQKQGYGGEFLVEGSSYAFDMLRAVLLLLHPFCLHVQAAEDRMNIHSHLLGNLPCLCRVVLSDIVGLFPLSKPYCPEGTGFEARIYNGLIYCI